MLSHLQHAHKDFYEFMAKGEKVKWEECVRAGGRGRGRWGGEEEEWKGEGEGWRWGKGGGGAERRERAVMGVASAR